MFRDNRNRRETRPSDIFGTESAGTHAHNHCRFFHMFAQVHLAVLFLASSCSWGLRETVDENRSSDKTARFDTSEGFFAGSNDIP